MEYSKISKITLSAVFLSLIYITHDPLVDEIRPALRDLNARADQCDQRWEELSGWQSEVEDRLDRLEGNSGGGGGSDYPTEESTGIQGLGLSEDDLVDYQGSYTIHGGDVLIEGMILSQPLDVRNVTGTITIRGCLFKFSDGDAIHSKGTPYCNRLVVENCSFDGPGRAVRGSFNGSVTVTGSNARRLGFDFIQLWRWGDDTCLVEGNYVREVGMTAGAHGDFFQQTSSVGASYYGLTIRGNTWDWAFEDAQAAGGSSNAFVIWVDKPEKRAYMHDFLLEGNMVRGGNRPIMQGGIGDNVVYRANIFCCYQYSLVQGGGPPGGSAEWIDNEDLGR